MTIRLESQIGCSTGESRGPFPVLFPTGDGNPRLIEQRF